MTTGGYFISAVSWKISTYCIKSDPAETLVCSSIFQLHTNDLKDYGEGLSLSAMEHHTSARHHISDNQAIPGEAAPAHRYISAGEGPATSPSKAMATLVTEQEMAILSPPHHYNTTLDAG